MSADFPTGMTSELPAITGNFDIISHNHERSSGKSNPPKVISTLTTVALATVVSRITGFLRTLLVGYILIAPATRSAFTTANSLPNQVAALALDAVLASVVVPVLVQAELQDPDGGKQFFDRLTTISICVLSAALAIALIFVPLFMPWQTRGLHNNFVAELFAYLLLPQVIFYGLSSLFSAALNVQGIYRIGAWAPVFNNLIALTALFIYYFLPGNPVNITHILVLGLGTSLGVICQALILLPALKKSDFFPRWSWGIDARLKKFSQLALAIILYVAISQLGLYMTLPLASSANANGPYTYYTCWQFLQVPYGVLGLTILTTVTPQLSRFAITRTFSAIRRKYRYASLISSYLLIPPVAFLMVMGTTVLQVLYGFHSENAHDIGQAISWSAFTIIPYAFVLIQLRIFYALDVAWTPIVIICIITGSRICLNYLGNEFLHSHDLVAWLGVSNGISFLLGALSGSILLRSLLRGPSMRRGDIRLFVFLLSLAFLSASCALIIFHLSGWQTNIHFITYILALILTGLFMLLIYFCALQFMGAFQLIEDSDLGRSFSRLTSPLERFLSLVLRHLPRKFAKVPPGIAASPNFVGSREIFPQWTKFSSPTNAGENSGRFESDIPELDDYSDPIFIAAEQRGSQYWKAKNTRLHRETGIILSQREFSMSQVLIELGNIESAAIVRVFDVIPAVDNHIVPTKDNQWEIVTAQWVSNITLSQAARTKPHLSQACSALEGLALAINYAHGADVTMGLGDPTCVMFTHSGKAVLVMPTNPGFKSQDIRGLAAILYSLLTGFWPCNFHPTLPWISDLPLATRHLKHLPSISSFNSTVDPEINDIIIKAIRSPEIMENAVRLITLITDPAQNTSSQLWILEEQETSMTPKFSPAPTRHNHKIPLTSLGIALVAILTAIVLLFSWSFSNYSDDTTQKDISQLFEKTPASASTPHPIHFVVDKLVDYTGNPATLDITHEKDLPHIITGVAPAWATDNYYQPDLSKAKYPSHGLGVVLELPTPQIVHQVTLISPSSGAHIQIYTYSPTAQSVDSLESLADETTIHSGVNTITLADPTKQSYMTIWITRLAKTAQGYGMSIEKISLM